MTSDGTVFTIGSMAKMAAIKTSRIRYYEEIGLLPKAARTLSGQRIYAKADLKRVIFIKWCRDIGFSLAQVRKLAGLSVSASRDCSEVGEIANEHLGEVRQKIAELQKLETTLRKLIDKCEGGCGGSPGRECLVFEDIRVS